MRVGDGAESTTQLGPINNAPQLGRVQDLVTAALDRGAVAVAGGQRLDRPGYFFAPTVLTGADERDDIVSEEQFGPALPVMTYRNIDDALERANATHYGLSGSVWGADSDRASAVAAQLECGTAWVNTHLALGPSQPFGGFKWSGVGVENGQWGLSEFVDIQTMYRSRRTDGLNIASAANLVS